MVELLDQLIEGQKARLSEEAKNIIANITSDDLLQPNDYAELEWNPYFRYEEGFLHGMQAVRSALMAEMAKNLKE
jgi:hypothetical protein